MNFKQRLSRYLVGIFIGVLLSFVLFGQRSCGKWLPDARVLNTISEQPLRTTADVDCYMKCYALSKADLEKLAAEGNVVYSKSAPRETPQRYYLQGNKEHALNAMSVELRDTASVVVAVFPQNPMDCKCPPIPDLQ